jgi:hypothetical protein
MQVSNPLRKPPSRQGRQDSENDLCHTERSEHLNILATNNRVMLNEVKHLAALSTKDHVMLNGVKHLAEDPRISWRVSSRYFTSFNMTMIAGISWSLKASCVEI